MSKQGPHPHSGGPCNLPHCDGTRLGHELARDFPKETAAIDDALSKYAGPREDYVMPENLQVDEPTKLDMWTVYKNPKDFDHGMDGDLYVLRHWAVTADGAVPDLRHTIADIDLEKVRAALPRGLTRLERAPHDDPAIVEVWL